MFVTRNYTIRSSKIPAAFAGFRIAHLSDLHGSQHGQENSDLIDQIDKEHPDIIAMTGDMADESPNGFSCSLNLCRHLRKRYPVYYVAGNHEQSLGKLVFQELMDELESMGVTVLENDGCVLQKGYDSICLRGLVTPMVYYKDLLKDYKLGVHFSSEDVRMALGDADPSCFQILLAHNPLYYPSYRDWGADLTLSGHIHGGVIRIPGLRGLLSPDMTFFPRYDGGHFVYGEKHLVVSRGLGNRFLVRVNNPAELVMIELKVK